MDPVDHVVVEILPVVADLTAEPGNMFSVDMILLVVIPK